MGLTLWNLPVDYLIMLYFHWCCRLVLQKSILHLSAFDIFHTVLSSESMLALISKNVYDLWVSPLINMHFDECAYNLFFSLTYTKISWCQDWSLLVRLIFVVFDDGYIILNYNRIMFLPRPEPWMCPFEADRIQPPPHLSAWRYS